MQLTRAVVYAARALAYLAGRPPAEVVASHAIAAATGTPARFLARILTPLVTARLLLAAKGPGGGYLLARPAGEITLLDVVEAVEGPVRGDVPPLGIADPRTG